MIQILVTFNTTQEIVIEKKLTNKMSSTNGIRIGTLIHEENNSRFICNVENVESGLKGACVLNYQILNKKENFYEFYHIEVPLQFRGSNIAPSFATVSILLFYNLYLVQINILISL